MNRDALNTVSCIRQYVIIVFSHIAICLLTFILFTDVLSLNFVPSESMEPTIRHNHLIINWRLSYLLGDPMPEYGAVIVFRENAEAKRLLVKRVIGLPGDTISFRAFYMPLLYCFATRHVNIVHQGVSTVG